MMSSKSFWRSFILSIWALILLSLPICNQKAKFWRFLMISSAPNLSLLPPPTISKPLWSWNWRFWRLRSLLSCSKISISWQKLNMMENVRPWIRIHIFHNLLNLTTIACWSTWEKCWPVSRSVTTSSTKNCQQCSKLFLTGNHGSGSLHSLKK